MPFRGGDWGFSLQRARCKQHKSLAVVGRVRSRGNAQKCGLRAGDVLVNVQGRAAQDETVTSLATIIRLRTLIYLKGTN